VTKTIQDEMILSLEGLRNRTFGLFSSVCFHSSVSRNEDATTQG
jgi:hypothetical protein